MPGENVIPPRTCLPAEKMEGKGGTKLVSERMAFARDLRMSEKSVGRQQDCISPRKGQPRCKFLGLVSIHCFSKRACLSLSVLQLSVS